jgi:vacuolar-type H+-ATPase subunit H
VKVKKELPMNVKIWDKIKSDGIADGEVLSFVNELLDQRDTFSQRQEHLLSLTKLAEKTIIEADKLAEDIKGEILDKAKAGASRITAEAEERAQQVITEAEERAQQVITEAEKRTQKVIAEAEKRAQQIVEEKEAEIVAVATEQAAAIRAEAEREAELLREQERQKVQGELRDRAQKLYGDLAVQLDVLKQRAAALEVEWEGELSPPAQTSTSTAAVEEEPLSSHIPAAIQQEDNPTPSVSSEASLESEVSPESEASLDPEASPESACVLNEVREMFEDSKSEDGKVEEEAPIATENQCSGTYAGGIELEIQQPISVKQIMEIKRYLQNWPEIGISELGPTTDGYSIVAFLREPIQLIDILKELPEVSRIEEDTPNAGTTKDAGTTKANGRPKKNCRPRKIKITLSENTDSV